MTTSIKHASFKNLFKHKFHLVDNSPLPIITAASIFYLVLRLVMFCRGDKDMYPLLYSTLLLTIILMWWFITVIYESGRGYHTWNVYEGLKYGMALFIVSEVAFFFAFFWSFFDVSLSPSVAIGAVWPPKSIQALDIWGLPLTNTLLLLSSGLFLTFAHYDVMSMNRTPRATTIANLLVTVILGITFLYCQFIEYKYGITFSWSENIYGSTFFVTTGFHGFHVIIGTIFLIICCIRITLSNLIFSSRYVLTRITFLVSYLRGLLKSKTAHTKAVYTETIIATPGTTSVRRMHRVTQPEKEYYKHPPILMHLLNLKKFEFTEKQHFGFEAAAWYWHFVDVVWIFLFLTIYWWGS